MKNKKQKARRLRRTRSEMESLLKKFERSKGASVKEFCRRHELGEGAFYNFRKKYRQQLPMAGGPEQFIAIESAVRPEGQAERLFAEVNGIRLYQPVTAEYLKSLCL